MDAVAQIQAKQQVLLDNFQHIAGLAPAALLPPLTADSWGYRRKARLGVRLVPKKGGVLVGFRERHSSYIAVMQDCEILDRRFARLIMPLRELIGQLSIANRVPQVEVAAGDDSACLVFRHLLPFSDEDLGRLAAFGDRHDVEVLLQARGPDSVTDLAGKQPGLLSYQLPDWNLDMYFRATDFTQVNASINRQMIKRALELLDARSGESVLDLFCGIGNFTLPLARQGARVTGIEGDSGLVAMARDNALRNAVEQADFITADLYQEPLEGSWLRNRYDRILLDPPRSGAMQVVKQLATLEAQRIVYVSCNPATLARDAQLLVNQAGYRLQAAGVMDMFPHTTHVESIAIFDAP
jgi:23S rRNA (uracil1939-C5)-methyltransferase